MALKIHRLKMNLPQSTDLTQTNSNYRETFVRTRPGEPFIVKLAQNASTGYHWTYSYTCPGVVECIGQHVRELNPGMVGSPSEITYFFRAKRAGVVKIIFQYLPPGTNTTPASVVVVHVHSVGGRGGGHGGGCQSCGGHDNHHRHHHKW